MIYQSYRTANQKMNDIPLMSNCNNCRTQRSCVHLKRIRMVTPSIMTVIIKECRDYKHTSLKDVMEEARYDNRRRTSTT